MLNNLIWLAHVEPIYRHRASRLWLTIGDMWSVLIQPIREF